MAAADSIECKRPIKGIGLKVPMDREMKWPACLGFGRIWSNVSFPTSLEAWADRGPAGKRDMGNRSLSFAAAFEHLTGNPPFPWQQALYELFIVGRFPESCDLPTGLGKTSVIPIWMIALAEAAGNIKGVIVRRPKPVRM
jgi:hypothetical protein